MMQLTKPKFYSAKKTTVKKMDRVLKMQIEELCEIQNPRLRDWPEKMAAKKKEYLESYKNKFVECRLPGHSKNVKILKEDLFFELRTARNKNLITAAEQKKFRNATVAIAGLSVGSNIARLLTLQGGPKKMNLADHDELGPTNLNRIFAGVHEMGKKKTEILAKSLYEMDPFAELNLFSQGVLDSNIEKFLQIDGKKVDVIFDEVDNIKTKLLLRQWAALKKIPIISIADSADGVIVSVEKHNDRYNLKVSIKKHKGIEFDREIGDMGIEEKAKIITKYIGLKYINARMLKSVAEVGKKIYSWPQIGGAAVMAGTMGAYCFRQIILNNQMNNQKLRIDLDKIFKINEGFGAKEKYLLIRKFR